MQRRDLKDEECFDGEPWSMKNVSLLEENCVFTEGVL
jgi:hypothetical protein